ncbi:tRNA lysidine(34) synthetase TilS [Vagococcus martis]|uniref:tRNA(Ile)-lysidine synthase n=1 Tax=Vagococcus martis TaxID=1768210 RepID=A0A1V4DHM3_9ENTE|nr:tRNA lysidine(34) synthetase TilS [Vagococcus martis]OPF87836.1 tRNA lysidine(34) synthetase TilS [Vagococcus martis]
MYQRFQQIIKADYHLTPDTRIVVGVSGGVDSMVLLHLLCQLPENMRPTIHVAHINHQLRKESLEEQEFVAQYAKECGLPIYIGVWDSGLTIKNNIEQEAREFRYHFFEDVMQETNSQMLLTAHHKDDHIETVLMRLIQGNQLKTLSGIATSRALGNKYQVIRPLLSFSKKELYLYAADENIPYYEDSSNFSNHYLRNRIRHHVRPMLESENPNIGESIVRLAEEVNQQAMVVESLLKPLIDTLMTYQNNIWQLDYLSLKRHNLAIQSEVIRYLLTDVQNKTKLPVGYEHVNQVVGMIQSDKPNLTSQLPNNWLIEKTYDSITVSKKSHNTVKHQKIHLEKNQGAFLSDTQWLGLFEVGKETLPEELESWRYKELVYTHGENHSIRVRKREDGDRFVYNRKGQTKKVSRYFIDEKIPIKLRDLSWLVFDEKGCLLWLLPFRESYLSIEYETDKIQYKLVYLYQEDE